jgi:protein tyrosine phosphatase (PTP) superfamily phosphohydrolase (DUF442 family)
MLASAAWWWIVAYDNYHTVIQGTLYRSAQVSDRELSDYIQRDRLATVINLREDTDATWRKKEKAVCRRNNVKHIDIPLSGGRSPTIEQMNALVEAFQANDPPFLLHCKHGADRTALAAALFLLTQDNSDRSPESAFSARYGHLPCIFQGTKQFDDAYARYKTMQGQQAECAVPAKGAPSASPSVR